MTDIATRRQDAWQLLEGHLRRVGPYLAIGREEAYWYLTGAEIATLEKSAIRNNGPRGDDRIIYPWNIVDVIAERWRR